MTRSARLPLSRSHPGLYRPTVESLETRVLFSAPMGPALAQTLGEPSRGPTASVASGFAASPGGQLAFVSCPRIGHEVIVAFHEGSPAEPREVAASRLMEDEGIFYFIRSGPTAPIVAAAYLNVKLSNTIVTSIT